MSTMLSFRDKFDCVLRLLPAFVIIGLLSCCRVPPPDAPQPARPVDKERPQPVDRTQLVKPAELRSVSVYKMDERMGRLAGEDFLSGADNPLVIEVLLVDRIDPTARASSPAIVLNEKPLINTRIHPDSNGDRLIAFLPDRKSIKDINSVAVVWLGNESLTLSKHPLTFKSTDIAE